MAERTEWEVMITEALVERLGVSYGDASAMIEAQPFVMSQAWSRDDDPVVVAERIDAASIAA